MVSTYRLKDGSYISGEWNYKPTDDDRPRFINSKKKRLLKNRFNNRQDI